MKEVVQWVSAKERLPGAYENVYIQYVEILYQNMTATIDYKIDCVDEEGRWQCENDLTSSSSQKIVTMWMERNGSFIE